MSLYSIKPSCQEAKTLYWNNQRQNIKQGWVDAFQAVVDAYAWDWYITLTFRDPCGTWKVESAWRHFTRYLRRAAGHRVEWFRIVEWQHRRDPSVPHIHATVLNCVDVRRRSAKKYWDNCFGFADVKKFDTEAAGLLSKYLSEDFAKDFTTDGGLAYFELSRNLRKYNRAEILARYPMFEKFDVEVIRHTS